VHESAIGTSRTSRDDRFSAAVGAQADIKRAWTGFPIYEYTT